MVWWAGAVQRLTGCVPLSPTGRRDEGRMLQMEQEIEAYVRTEVAAGRLVGAA